MKKLKRIFYVLFVFLLTLGIIPVNVLAESITVYEETTYEEGYPSSEDYDSQEKETEDDQNLTQFSIMDIPTDAKEYNNHSYKVFNISTDWETAKAYCEMLGGHLVSITTQEEQFFIESLIDNEIRNSYWLGAERDQNRMFTSWITGEPILYTKYDIYQPDQATGSEDCLVIYRLPNPRVGGSQKLYWNDLQKDGECRGQEFFGLSNIGFICEWDWINSSISTLKFSSTSGSINVGSTMELKSKLSGVSSSTKLSWSSSDEKIATVSNSGVIKGIKAGTATITVSTGSQKATYKVTVKAVNSSSSTFAFKSDSYTVKKGASLDLNAELQRSNISVSWKSSNTKIATVSSTGKLKGIKAGTVTITASGASTKSAKCTVTVIDSNTSTSTDSSDSPWSSGGAVEKSLEKLGDTNFSSTKASPFMVNSINGMTTDEKAAVIELAQIWQSAIESDINKSFTNFKIKKAAIKMDVKMNGKKQDAYLVHWEAGLAGQSTGATYFVLYPGTKNQRSFLINMNATASTKTFSDNMQKYLKDTYKKEFYKWATGKVFSGIYNESTAHQIMVKYLNKATKYVKGNKKTQDKYHIKDYLNNYINVKSSGTVRTFNINTTKF